MPYGYNYYSPNGSATTSPVILMPYPYQFDPFFMAPNTEVSSTVEIEQNGNDESNDKKENEGAKENETIDAAEEDNNVSLFLFLFLFDTTLHIIWIIFFILMFVL
jgi:hypothetical protein